MKTLTLIWKELLMVLRDKKVRLSIIIPPLMQLFIFSYAATLDVKNVAIGIVNRDSGEKGIELVERFQGSPFFNKIVFLPSIESVKPFLDNQRGVMVVSIGEEFTRSLDSHKETPLQILLDGRKSNTAQILLGYMVTLINQYNQDISLAPPPAKLIPRNWFNPNLIYLWFNIPSLVCLLTQITCLIITTQSIAREREMGTFDQILVSPLSSFQILVGKMVPGMLVGLFEGSLMLLIGVVFFQVPFTGSWLLFLLAQVVFVFAISGFGLFISSLSATQQQAMLGSFVFITPSVLMSGFATPIENMPAWIQPLTNLIPLKYMLVIGKGIFLKAMPARLVLEGIGPMFLIGLTTQVASAYLFKRRNAA